MEEIESIWKKEWKNIWEKNTLKRDIGNTSFSMPALI
jgi:hypothetical protein